MKKKFNKIFNCKASTYIWFITETEVVGKYIYSNLSFFFTDINNYTINLITNTVFNIELIELSLIPEFFLGFSSIVLSIFVSLVAYNQRYSFYLVQKILVSLSSVFFILTTVLLVNDGLLTSSKQISLNSLSFCSFLSSFSKFILLIISYLCLLAIWKYIVKDVKLNNSEYLLLFIYVSLGLVLLISANDLLSLFLTLELQGLSLYVISAFKKDSIHSISSGLKYFILGAFSSSLFLFGSSFIYGLTGLTHFFSFNFFFFDQLLVNDTFNLLIEDRSFRFFFICFSLPSYLIFFLLLWCQDPTDEYAIFSVIDFLFSDEHNSSSNPTVVNESATSEKYEKEGDKTLLDNNTERSIKKDVKDSVELSDLIENSNKYFDKIEKVIYNFFKTIRLAIPIFIVVLLCGLLFKVAAAPFHLWVLDIYEGSPTSSTLIFAVLTKISIIVILIKICYYCFYTFFIKDLSQCINFTGLLSIFIGSVAGLSERKIKSLLTFSSINNIGYLLLALATSVKNSIHSIFMYLINYTNANLALWTVIITIQLKKNRFTKKLNKDFSDILSLIKKNKVLQGLTIITIFSLAGIPPFIGFLAKWNILLSIIESKANLTASIAVILSVISSFYYLRILKIMQYEESFLIVEKLCVHVETLLSGLHVTFNFFTIYQSSTPWVSFLFSQKIVIC